MNLFNKILFFIIFIPFFSNNLLAAENKENIVIDDAIIVESDFDLEKTIGKTTDLSDIDPIEGFNRQVWDFNLGLD